MGFFPLLRFIGIDLAWKVEPPKPHGTGYCVIDDRSIIERVGLLTTDQEILDLIGDDACWVGIDASLVVPEGKRIRECERRVRSLGMRILPTNRDFYGRAYGGCRGETLARQLQAWGYRLFGDGDNVLFEVYPHAVLRALCPQDPPQYKKGAREDRKEEGARLLRLLGEWEPHLSLPSPLMPELSDGMGMADRLDALLAAVLLYRHWLYAGRRSLIVGDEDDGRILLPRGDAGLDIGTTRA